MNTKPLVSIIVPVYNVEDFVLDCIDSILSQTYDNIEIIIIDDGSPDSSYEKCHNKYNNIEKVKIIQQKNAGVSAARNTGIKNASGKYVLFVDSDDVICKNCVESLVKLIEENNVDCVNFIRKNTFNDLDARNYMKYMANSHSVHANIFSTFEILTKITTNALEIGLVELFKTDIIKDNNLLFDQNIKHNEDKLFKIEYYLHSKNILMSNEHMYGYRIRNNSASHTKLPKAYYDIILAAQKMSDVINVYDTTGQLYKYAKYNEHETLLAFLRQIGKNRGVYNTWKEKYADTRNKVLSFDVSSFKDMIPLRSKLERVALKLPFIFYSMHISTYYALLNIRTKFTR